MKTEEKKSPETPPEQKPAPPAPPSPEIVKEGELANTKRIKDLETENSRKEKELQDSKDYAAGLEKKIASAMTVPAFRQYLEIIHEIVP